MLTFEFEARSRNEGRLGSLTIFIREPVRLTGPSHDYECRIEINGVVVKETRAVGVTPFQAVDLALQVTKSVVSAYAADWDLFFEGDGPIKLAY